MAKRTNPGAGKLQSGTAADANPHLILPTCIDFFVFRSKMYLVLPLNLFEKGLESGRGGR